jgi:HTH-type transcriptional repressor of NAD biosynthesis genes
MKKAFVFGKFLPFHKGHEALIRFALSKADFLTVLICCSNYEETPPEKRVQWIQDAFQMEPDLEISVLHYLEEDLPNTSVASEEVSFLWSKKFKEILPDYELVITSEEYGDYVAGFMGIQHIAFDIPRNLYPVSASAIRSDRTKYWQFLPDSVKPDFACKVVILGTESTGKTTLANQLADYFQCTVVQEAGRDLIAHSDSVEFDQLESVAVEHARRIEEATKGPHPLLIIDTDIHITLSYARFLFGSTLNLPDSVFHRNKADLYLYCTRDVPFVQDGTRLGEEQRNKLDESHRTVLQSYGISFTELTGSWESRFKQAVDAVADLSLQLKNSRIPFYAVPVYNYDPLTIQVGKFSGQLQEEHPARLLALADRIKSEIDEVPIEALYVLSIRLYDLGKKDEAVYWFYTAQNRARIFMGMVDQEEMGGMGSDAFELMQLFSAFNQIVGIYLNGYAFNDVEKLIPIVQKVRAEVQDITSCSRVYKNVQFLPDANLDSCKKSKEEELDGAIIYLRENKDEIKKKRIEAGIQDKY